MSGTIEQHILEKGKLNYMIGGSFIANENVIRDELLKTTKETIARDNAIHILSVLQNGDMPGALKESVLQNATFQRGEELYTIESYKSKEQELILFQESTQKRYTLHSRAIIQS